MSNEDSANLKIPPQNLEAEQSVLGAMMIDREAIIKRFAEIMTKEIAEKGDKR